jgi:hypothetical protein
MANVILAQDESSVGWVILSSLVLLVLVLVLFGAVMVLRKKMSPDEDFHGAGFSLSDLRAMHKKGQMSDEEFSRAKMALLATMNKAPAKSAGDVETKNLTPRE